mmetsp:Transcript_28055/g.53116  ORF Transcript_28055/g.53116 Transcript_28055/m.53116 type:complete len:207 (-) Transcript_28055:56-676(-)
MKVIAAVGSVFMIILGQVSAFSSFLTLKPSTTTSLHAFVTHFTTLQVPTGRGVSMVDLTSEVANVVKDSKVVEGVVTVLSKHSTVGVMINEWEPRFVDDARHFLLGLAPREGHYLHNDLDYRVGPPDWPGGDEAWRAFRQTEPVNAHSHLIQFVVGTTESIPVHESKMTIGTYQNIIVCDADGPVGTLGSPKTRNIVVQVQGCDGQ